MKAIAAIKKYFGTDRSVGLSELKELSVKEREELGRGACEAMGVEFIPSNSK